MKRKKWWILSVLAVIAVAGGLYVARRGPKPTGVQIGTVGHEDLEAKVTCNGRVQAKKKVDISATVAGQVTELAVKEGDRVKKGQMLLKLDPASPKAAALSTQASMAALERELDAARVTRDQAVRDLRRAEESHRSSIISQAELDRAKASLATTEAAVKASEQRVAQARATFDGARDALKKTQVEAPMDGIVTARNVEEGEVAVVGVLNQPGTVLLTISDMSVVETEMEVDETSIPSVKLGQKARVRIDAYPNKTFEGAVTEVAESPVSRTSGLSQNEAIKFKVKIELGSPPADIKPGLSAQADILTAFKKDALVIPFQALVVRDIEKKPGETTKPGAPKDEEGVYIAGSGKVRFQPIKTGLLGDMSVEVLDGLKGGETIITGPYSALRSLNPGDAIRPEPAKKEGSQASGSQ